VSGFSLKRIMAKTIQIDGCREWQGGFVRGRWPRMYARIDGKETAISVRPVVWKLTGGRDLLPGEVITMKCGCEACLERRHMEVIDKGEVSRRNWAKPGAKMLRSLKCQAASADRAKLDMQKAREIRSRLAGGETQVALCAEFEVSQALLSRVARGTSWKDYSSPFAGLGSRA
jgi:hypothetical protein